MGIISVFQNETKPVQMMQQKAKFPFTYISDVNSQILELPYVGKDLSMLVMLPNEVDGLEKVLAERCTAHRCSENLKKTNKTNILC